jgi:hypothetical protein
MHLLCICKCRLIRLDRLPSSGLHRTPEDAVISHIAASRTLTLPCAQTLAGGPSSVLFRTQLPAQCDLNICAPNTGFPAVTYHQATHKRPEFSNAVSSVVDLEWVDHLPASTNQQRFCYALSNYPSLLAPRFNTEWTLVELIAVCARSSINGPGGEFCHPSL